MVDVIFRNHSSSFKHFLNTCRNLTLYTVVSPCTHFHLKVTPTGVQLGITTVSRDFHSSAMFVSCQPSDSRKTCVECEIVEQHQHRGLQHTLRLRGACKLADSTSFLLDCSSLLGAFVSPRQTGALLTLAVLRI